MLKNINELINACLNNQKVKILTNIKKRDGSIIIKKDTIVNKSFELNKIKKNGIIGIYAEIIETKTPQFNIQENNKIEAKIEEFQEVKKNATEIYSTAKKNIQQILNSIKTQNGKFDSELVGKTVNNLTNFIDKTENAFAYLSKEIFTHDNYLHHHSINVCTIGTAILSKINKKKKPPKKIFTSIQQYNRAQETKIIYYKKQEILDIAKGFFLHDVGKMLVPSKILNKPSKLTDSEFKVMQEHSYIMGLKILNKNNDTNPFVKNCVELHHAKSYYEEDRGYPITKEADDLPFYIHICKLADIYDALTSKRCYKEAISPIAIVTKIFRLYTGKGGENFKKILLEFVNTIGVAPPNTVVFLSNGQKAYVIDSNGPIVIPFTDTKGNTVNHKLDTIDIKKNKNIAIDNSKEILPPKKTYEILPSYLKKMYAD